MKETIVQGFLDQADKARGDREFLTVIEVATIAGVTDKAIYNEIRRGNLEAVYFGRSVRVYPESYERWIRARIQMSAA